MLEARTPVTKTTTSVSSTPIPGIWYPSSAWGWYCGGRSCSVWSIVVTMRSSTQIVIASGIQMSRPVMRIFFIECVGLRKSRRRSRRPRPPQAAASDFFDSDLPSGLLAPASLLSDLLASLASDFAAPLSAALAEVSPEVFAAGFDPLFLKSVAYQPLPLSLKPAALSILEK